MQKIKIPRYTFHVILAVIVLLVLFGNAGFRALMRRYWELHKLKAELSQLKRENALLKEEVYHLENNPSYIERIARKELGVIAPGEIEYRFKPEE